MNVLELVLCTSATWYLPVSVCQRLKDSSLFVYKMSLFIRSSYCCILTSSFPTFMYSFFLLGFCRLTCFFLFFSLSIPFPWAEKFVFHLNIVWANIRSVKVRRLMNGDDGAPFAKFGSQPSNIGVETLVIQPGWNLLQGFWQYKTDV